MSIYILIHGSWHGGWCWNKVVPLLQEKGHVVIAPDLPGHGNDKTPVPKMTLKAYSDRVCEILDGQSKQVILVGHSMGGVVVTQTAESRPDKIEKLVYLAGFLPRNGQSLLELAKTDTESLVLPNLIIDEANGLHWIREEAVKDVLYHDCSNEDLARAKSLMVKEPLAPVNTPVSTTQGNFGRVHRVYVECLRDRTISPSLQREMYTAVPCRKVISMETSHSPFFSAPEKLAAHLTSL